MSLSQERLESLHEQFLQAGQKHHLLHHIAGWAPSPNWPCVQSSLEPVNHDHLGIESTDWPELIGADVRRESARHRTHPQQWLWFNDKLWDAGYLADFPECRDGMQIHLELSDEQFLVQTPNLMDEEFHLRVCRHRTRVEAAIRQFTELAREAAEEVKELTSFAGFDLDQELLGQDSSHRWLEAIHTFVGKVELSSSYRFEVSRLPENVFIASAKAIEAIAGSHEAEQKQVGCEPSSSAAGWWSPRDLANEFNVSLGALQQRLKRWRRNNADGWIEVPRSERRPNEPQFLYKLDAVQPVIDDMKAV